MIIWGNDWNKDGDYDFADMMTDYFVMDKVLGLFNDSKNDDDDDDNDECQDDR